MAANHIKIILFKTDYPPCYEPAVLAGLSWLKKVLRNSFQKTGTFFGASGSRNIRKQIAFFLKIPPPILKNIARKRGLFSRWVYPAKTGKDNQLANTSQFASSLRKALSLSSLDSICYFYFPFNS
ncbi:hypothetical protein ES705_43070 [subsurface metagenome]